MQARVQHVGTGVGDGRTHVQRAAWLHLAGGSHHGDFGRAVVVDQGKAWVAVELAQPVPPYQQGAQGGVLLLAAKRLLGHRGGQKADGKGLLQPPVEQFFHVLVADVRRRQVQGGAGTQGRPGFPGKGIEAETGNARDLGACAYGECLAMPMHQVGQGLMFDHYALGLAGGA